MRTIRIATAPKADLLAAARDVLNLDVGDDATNDQLRAAIMAAHTESTIQIPGDDPQGVPLGGPAMPAVEGGKTVSFSGKTATTDAKGRVWVILEARESDVLPYYEVGVNGRTILIPLGKESPIPVSYFEVLCNSIRRIPIVKDGYQITGWREVMERNFQILPPRNEMAAA